MPQPAGNRLRRDNLAAIAVLSFSLAAVLATTGCGNQYRPVVSAIGPVGPAGQPTKYAVAVSSPSSTSLGLVTVVDFSGDTVLSTPQILINPSYLQLNGNGTQGYVINPQGSLNTFLLTNPAALITSTVIQTTLPVNSAPVSITAVTPASTVPSIFIPEADTNSIAAINSTTAALYDNVGIVNATNPVYVVGTAGTPRVYAISQNSPGSNGQIDSLEAISTTTLSDSAQIPVGIKPVYGVMTADDRRAFILNEGSGTVTVVNVPSNALDVGVPATATTPLGTITVGQNPVWADLAPVNAELVVLNQGDGVHPGTLNIISIPLCNPSAQANNPNCVASNPVDAVGFGTVLATATVGIKPTMVSVLQDGSAAYVINTLDGTGTCAAGSASVSAVNLKTGQVSATICSITDATALASGSTTQNMIYGNLPNSISATTSTPTGKVYITSSDSKYLSVLYTDTNTIQTHIPLQGLGVRVLVNLP
jgi:hypothetical protein